MTKNEELAIRDFKKTSAEFDAAIARHAAARSRLRKAKWNAFEKTAHWVKLQMIKHREKQDFEFWNTLDWKITKYILDDPV